MSTNKQANGNDESWVISAIGWTLLLGLAGLFISWKYSQHITEKEAKLREGRAAVIYNDYVADKEQAAPASKPGTQGPQTARSASKAANSTSTMAQRLLSTPGVTAGPGFSSEGVQETGVVILDAIERANTSSGN